MTQEESYNHTQHPLADGLDNESVSAIEISNQSIPRFIDRPSDQLRANHEGERLQNEIYNIQEEIMHNQAVNDEENKDSLDRDQNLRNLIRNRLFTRHNFNRIFTDLSIEYVARKKRDIYRNFICYSKTFKDGDAYLETVERSTDCNGDDIEMDLLIRCRRKILIRAIIEDFILSFTCLLMILYSSQVIPIPSYVCTFFLIFALLPKFVCQLKSYCICETVFHFILIFFSIFRVVILTFVLAKLDHLIDWKWSAVIWCYWPSLVILSIISFFILLVLIGSVNEYFRNVIEYQLVIGLFYLFILVGGIPASTFVTALNVIKMFGNNSIEITHLEIFTNLFLPNLAYIVVVITLNIIFWKPLISSWNYFFYCEKEQDENEGNFVLEGEQHPNREKRILTVELSKPIFIERISNTLYAISKRRVKNKVGNNNKLKAEEQKSTLSEFSITSENNYNIKGIDRHSCSKDIPCKQFLHQKNVSFGKNLELRRNQSLRINRDSKNRHSLHKRYISNSVNSNACELDLSYCSNLNLNREGELVKICEKDDELAVKGRSYHTPKYMSQDLKNLYSDKINSFGKEIDVVSTKSVSEKCSICFDKPSDAVLMDCGHGGICYECACTLIMIDERCHFCRCNVSSILRIEKFKSNNNNLKINSVSIIDCEGEDKCIDDIIMNLKNEESKSQCSGNSEEENCENSMIENEPKNPNLYVSFAQKSPK